MKLLPKITELETQLVRLGMGSKNQCMQLYVNQMRHLKRLS